MSIELAEQLKRELTDKYVVVQTGVPELRRFAKLTGQVKTVNMNGKALVQFNSPEDIGWYDIDPSYLRVVAQPQPKGKGEEKHEPKAAAKPAAAKPAAGMSPLEMARAQGAGPATPAAPAPAKALSPLELARQQGAVGAKPAAPAGDKPLSPLEQARQQGAMGAQPKPAAPQPAAPKVPPPAPKAPEPAPAPVAKTPAPVPKPAAPKEAPQALSTEEILQLARQQGAFTG